MGARHGVEINGLAILGISGGAVALVVSEAVLDADDDPDITMASAKPTPMPASQMTYHKLVKTTPKPRATKNSSGELVGPLEPPPPPPLVSEGMLGGGTVEEDMAGSRRACSGNGAMQTSQGTEGQAMETKTIVDVKEASWAGTRSSGSEGQHGAVAARRRADGVNERPGGRWGSPWAKRGRRGETSRDRETERREREEGETVRRQDRQERGREPDQGSSEPSLHVTGLPPTRWRPTLFLHPLPRSHKLLCLCVSSR